MTNTLLMDRRRLLQGAGYISLAFSIPAIDALAQAPAGDKPRLPGDLNSVRKIGAWIQINADKTVTLLIGKVELGQGILTAVAQICADDLDIDV